MKSPPAAYLCKGMRQAGCSKKRLFKKRFYDTIVLFQTIQKRSLIHPVAGIKGKNNAYSRIRRTHSPPQRIRGVQRCEPPPSNAPARARRKQHAGGMLFSERERPLAALEQDADQATGMLVDDLFERLPDLAPRVVRHPAQLVRQLFLDQLGQGFPEDVCFPDALRVVLEFA